MAGAERREVLATGERKSKVTRAMMAPPPKPLPGFLEQLPRVLAAESLHAIVDAISEAYHRKKPVVFTMGAHVIKCGLAPIIITLMQQGIITSVATNGAAIIHDSELALFGHTSEDVETALGSGTFGMNDDTHRFINEAINCGIDRGLGIGAAIGEALLAAPAPYREQSLFAQASLLNLSATVHVALGTDVVHLHPSADGARIGEGSLRDFRQFVRVVSELGNGGVLVNVGSAVILPEVVLKAFAALCHQGVSLAGCVTADFDMVPHYRPIKQIVERVTVLGGRGYPVTGHHEIMLPLLAGLVLSRIESKSEACSPVKDASSLPSPAERAIHPPRESE